MEDDGTDSPPFLRPIVDPWLPRVGVAVVVASNRDDPSSVVADTLLLWRVLLDLCWVVDAAVDTG